MILSEDDLQALATRFWETHRFASAKPRDKELEEQRYEAWELVRQATDDADDFTIPLLVAIAEKADGDLEVAYAGASFMEDALTNPTDRLLDQYDGALRRSIAFRAAFQCTWGSRMPEHVTSRLAKYISNS